MYILIIEDDQNIREVLKLVVEKECQAKCFETSNVRESLNVMYGVLFDAIIVDFHLGNENAITIIKLAKEQNVPTIVISASPNARQAIEPYDVEFINKPFSYESFVQVLDTICVKNI